MRDGASGSLWTRYVFLSHSLSLKSLPKQSLRENYIKKETAMKMTRPVIYLFHKYIHRLGNVQGRRAAGKQKFALLTHYRETIMM